ncbi:hypothetical protein JOM56_005153 [Amanita muscaria]
MGMRRWFVRCCMAPLIWYAEGEYTSTMRVQKLLATLVKRKDLTAFTTKFVCREWPEWFPPSPNDVSLAEEFKEDGEKDVQEIKLQSTFLASTLVLVLFHLTGLKELVVPFYHPTSASYQPLIVYDSECHLWNLSSHSRYIYVTQ